MEYDDKQIIYVSSQKRIYGSSSNFSIRFDVTNNGDSYDHVGVLYASIPKSYYLITQYNDEFILTEGLLSVNIHIPIGNYTLTVWKKTLSDLLNSNSPNNFTYVVDFPGTNAIGIGKLTFTVSGNGLTQPQFTFNEYLYKQMGFTQGTYSFVNNTLVSINVINLQLIDALFINSDICNNKSNSVLQEIYSNNDDFANITYQATSIDAYSKKIAIKNNDVYSFYLTDTNGFDIDLNGLDYNFTLILYKKNNTLDMIKNYIKLSLIQ